MRMLFIGDVVGKPGRRLLKNYLPGLMEKERVDLAVANGENAAGGAGITEKVYRELLDCGVSVVTGGNHSWDQKDVFSFIDGAVCLLRPANLPQETTPGKGALIFEAAGTRIGIINLLGRVFMSPVDCPFRRAEAEIAALKKETGLIVVDFHAEATSEKQAMAWFLDGKVGAVIGTHSHVQTADARILPGETAYITDVGMVGLYDSILGVDPVGPLNRFLTGLPHRIEITGGRTCFNAVLLEFEGISGKAKVIKPIFEIFE